MTQIAIVDDEKEESAKLEALLQRYFAEVSKEFQVKIFSSEEALMANYKPVYDIIFLDIELAGNSGLVAAERIRQQDNHVVLYFCTKMAQYALQGYKVRARNYFVKPIHYYDLKLELDDLLPTLEKAGKQYFLNIKVDGVIRRISTQDIFYIESNAHILVYHLAKEVIKARGIAISSLESKLAPYGFACCSASFLVNLSYCVSLQKEGIVLADKSVLPITRTKRKDFLEALNKYFADGSIRTE